MCVGQQAKRADHVLIVRAALEPFLPLSLLVCSSVRFGSVSFRFDSVCTSVWVLAKIVLARREREDWHRGEALIFIL